MFAAPGRGCGRRKYARAPRLGRAVQGAPRVTAAAAAAIIPVMDERYRTYRTPLSTRWGTAEMRELFGDQRRIGTWRRLWLVLAEAQQELGLDIPEEALEQMRAHLDDIDFDRAAELERELRHDVMAHIHVFADAAPAAGGLIHLGATSQFVNCNTDLIQIREGLRRVARTLANLIDALGTFAATHAELPCLAYTHFQPAQLTTVGKRAALWAAEFLMDLEEIERRIETLAFRSTKGTTGTQASFLALFDGDHGKVKQLERRVAEKMGFENVIPVTGQTYSRKVDAAVTAALAGLGASTHKFCNDIRLLANKKELEEPFGAKQVGSSAMAYKRNPMRCERATGLARWLMDISVSPLHTAAEQWFERTLDDSSNRRMSIAEAFLTTDAMLQIVLNVAQGLVVYPAVIDANLRAELPFMATENVLMAAVKAGGNRQDLHERIRAHSMAAAEQVKRHGRANDLIERLKDDEAFAGVDIEAELDPAAFVGRAPQQTREFIDEHIEPVRRRYTEDLGRGAELKV